MKDKIKGVINTKLYPAFLISLLGLDLSLLICTIMGASGIFKRFLPLWSFILFTLLCFISDIVIKRINKWWIKPLVYAVAAFIIILMLIFI